MEISYDIVCFSHLRWGFVLQRPQHLLSRCARERRVYYIEEPVFVDAESHLDLTFTDEQIGVVVPHISHSVENVEAVQSKLLRELFAKEEIERYVLWFYTPMALPLAAQLAPLAVVYDCMDQLAAFKNAPTSLHDREQALFARADLVFTGGHALYEAKRGYHANIHPFPSSVDFEHFARARAPQRDPEDQAWIGRPRLGFFGVIDERMDLELLRGVAAARAAWQIILIGPVVKIDEAELPRSANIHYLGGKRYADLPHYIAGWDLALLPFARNEATRFISPTKTPEYLAAGVPVVSTPIQDVMRPYEKLGLVRIAESVVEFVDACERALSESSGQRAILADAFLAELSWDKTWSQMRGHIDEAVRRRFRPTTKHFSGAQTALASAQSSLASAQSSDDISAGEPTCSTI